MSAYPTCEILVGDCLEWLRTFPDNHFHCVVTSPPYYGLRDYGVAGQIGLEESPAAFLAKMVEVFREVRRVLREDGTCWVNMGDSYATTPGQQGNGQMRGRGIVGARGGLNTSRGMGFKPKDLMGMPWRLAFALQDDGWWLRQDIIWSKPNPMPESVTDRCCKSHEYLFLLTKRSRYFYDAEAVKEPVSGTANARGGGVNEKAKAPQGWDTSSGEGGHGTVHREGRTNGTVRTKQNDSFSAAVNGLVSTRHKRSVWTIQTEACRDAHFATFPQALVRPCVLAGSSAGGACSGCGTPLTRVIEKGEADLEHQRACGGDLHGEYHGKATKDFKSAKAEDASEVKARILRGMVERKTVGWERGCKCEGTTIVPCRVADIFGGSGTTGMVALELGRSAVLIEINPEYAEIARARTNVTPGMF